MSELPQSNALGEANPQESLAELFSRFPPDVRARDPQAFKRLIAELRAQAERNAIAEAAGKPRRAGAKIAASAPKESTQAAEDLL